MGRTPEELQYRFDINPDTNSFEKVLPPVLESRRLERLRKKNHEIMMDEWKRGVNCPDKSIVETRTGIDLNYDVPFTAIITKEGDIERAYRYVGEVVPRKNGMVAIEDIDPWALSLVENRSKLVFMPGIILDSQATYGPDMIISPAIHEGGVVFKTKKEAKGKYGAWEELEGNGQGAFRMFRRLPTHNGISAAPVAINRV